MLPDHLFDMGKVSQALYSCAQEHHAATGAPDAKLLHHIGEGTSQLNKAWEAHNRGDYAAATTALVNTANKYTDAAKHYSANTGSEDPLILDTAHLGHAHEIVQNYVDEVNKGKNNGS